MLPCDLWNWDTFSLTLCYINVTNHIPDTACGFMGSCKTFQRLPMYQCFKRQLNNVICIWATEYANMDWGVSQLGSQEQHFSKAVVAQLGNAVTKFGLLQSIGSQCSFLLLFPMCFPPVSEFPVRFQPCLGTVQAVSGAYLATHPNPQYTGPCLAAALKWAAHTSVLTKEGPHVSCFRLNNEFSKWINDLFILKTPVLYACELLKPPDMTCWLQEWCLLSFRVTEAHPKYMFSFLFLYGLFLHIGNKIESRSSVT